jgi:hypothetical protein
MIDLIRRPMLVRLVCKHPIVKEFSSGRVYWTDIEDLIAWISLQTFDSRKMDEYRPKAAEYSSCRNGRV